MGIQPSLLLMWCPVRYAFLSLTYSKMSPGWQSSALQIASKVLNLIAFAFPVFKIERFDKVSPTFSESSFSDIFRFAIITSKFTMIATAYTVKSFSFWMSTPFLKIVAIIYSTAPIKIKAWLSAQNWFKLSVTKPWCIKFLANCLAM